MISTLGLFSPLKKLLLRSVLTTSLSTVNSTFLQNSLCSSGLMDSLQHTQHSLQQDRTGLGEGGGVDQQSAAASWVKPNSPNFGKH